jgi:hypothetical protein
VLTVKDASFAVVGWKAGDHLELSMMSITATSQKRFVQ